jgi:thiol peroxidase
MASILLSGKPVNTNGELPKVGSKAPDFKLTATDLKIVSLADFAGSKIILNIFPSIDTPTCATSTRTFNARANKLENTKILCIARDLPFAFKRFCGAEGLENVVCLSDFNTGDFGKDYGVEFTDGAFVGLHSRAIVVIDENGIIKHTEQVENTSNEPNYEAAEASL